jgi:hypothetical protein
MKLQELFEGLFNLHEALKPSQYRKYVKGWDKSKWAELFNNKYRIYLPLEISDNDIEPNKRVVDYLKKLGYSVKDYAKNLAVDNNGREKRIGSLVSKDLNIKKIYDNDPVRSGAKQSNRMVVISRHPYDIAGSSTDRGWTSCQNLSNDLCAIGGDIEAGTLVAYLINKDDKNIKSPSARIMIKPFTDGEDVALGIQNAIYGERSKDFLETVRKWVDNVNESKKLNGIFWLDPRTYNDSMAVPALYMGGYVNKKMDEIGEIFERSVIELLSTASKLWEKSRKPKTYYHINLVNYIIRELNSGIIYDSIKEIKRYVPTDFITEYREDLLELFTWIINDCIHSIGKDIPNIPHEKLRGMIDSQL